MSVKLFVAVKAVIFNESGEVLVIRESPKYTDSTQAGKFDLPGGRITPGESLHAALKREVMEETGLDIEIGNVFHTSEWNPIVREEQWQIICIFFKCKALTTKVTLSSDHDAFKWIKLVNAGKENVMENYLEVFEKI